MINEKHFMGRDGFYWFIGKVVDRNDTMQLGRVRVRVFGIHPDDENLVPNDHLPWAIPVQPVTSAGVFGVGQSPTGLLVGSYVFGFFADGQDAQIPVVIGSIASSLGHYVYQAIDTVSKAVEESATEVANAAKEAIQTGPPVNSGPPNQEFWTLVALVACETGVSSGQDQCDIAQTVYNRSASGAYGKKSPLGIILTNMQYEPTWALPRGGLSKYGVPNEYWQKITDANSAAKATGKFSAQQMLQVGANLRNATYQEESRRFVQGRTDFLGIGQPAVKMTQNGSKIQRSSKSNQIGFSGNYKGSKGIAGIPSSVTNQGK